MLQRQHTLLGSLVLLTAVVLLSDRVWAEQTRVALRSDGVRLNTLIGLNVGRIGRPGRLRVPRSWSTSTRVRSLPSKVQSPPRVAQASVPPPTSTKLTTLGRTIFWLFCLGSLGGVLFFLVALFFGLLKFRPQRYRIR